MLQDRLTSLAVLHTKYLLIKKLCRLTEMSQSTPEKIFKQK
jgi:hypothetical protein